VPSVSLEKISQRKLNLTRATVTKQSAKLIPYRRNTLTKERRWPQRIIIASHQSAGRIREIGMVEEIEDLRTKLNRTGLSHPRVLEDLKIYLRKTRTAQNVPACIAEYSVAGI
jgi:hypothetical protein